VSLVTSTPTRRDLEHFRRLVLEDISLQEQLRETTDVKSFLELVLKLGREGGCDFNQADVEEALRAGRRAWFETWI
jgi:hypothetical protein